MRQTARFLLDLTAGRVGFDGSLSGIPGLGNTTLSTSGWIKSDGTFDVTSSAEDPEVLDLAGFGVESAVRVENVTQPGTTRVHIDGGMSLLGTSFDVWGDLGTDGSGSLNMTLVSTPPTFGGLSGFDADGTFLLDLTDPAVGFVDFTGSLAGIPGLGNTTLSASGWIKSDGTFDVTSSAEDPEVLDLAGFQVESAVRVENITEPGVTRVYFDGRLETLLLGASFTAKGDLGTDGKGDLALMLESSETPQLNIGGFDIDMSDSPDAGFTFTLSMTGFAEGSVGFTGSLTGIPGMGDDENEDSAKLGVAGNIHSNGAFDVSGFVANLSFAGFAVDASVTVANYDILDFNIDPGSLQSWPFGTWDPAEVRVYIDGGMSLLGTSFDVEGDLGTDGSGSLNMTLVSTPPTFGGLNGFDADGTFLLDLTDPAVGFVDFTGSLAGIPGLGNTTLSASGWIKSDGTFDVTSSAEDPEVLDLAGFQVESAVRVENITEPGVTRVYFDGSLETLLLGASFTAKGDLGTDGKGDLALMLGIE